MNQPAPASPINTHSGGAASKSPRLVAAETRLEGARNEYHADLQRLEDQRYRVENSRLLVEQRTAELSQALKDELAALKAGAA